MQVRAASRSLRPFSTSFCLRVHSPSCVPARERACLLPFPPVYFLLCFNARAQDKQPEKKKATSTDSGIKKRKEREKQEKSGMGVARAGKKRTDCRRRVGSCVCVREATFFWPTHGIYLCLFSSKRPRPGMAARTHSRVYGGALSRGLVLDDRRQRKKEESTVWRLLRRLPQLSGARDNAADNTQTDKQP